MKLTTKSELKKFQLDCGYYALRFASRGETWATAHVKSELGSKHHGFDILGNRVSGRITLNEKHPLALLRVYDSYAIVELEFLIASGRDLSDIVIDIEKISPSKQSLVAQKQLEFRPSLVRLSGHLEGVGDTDVKSGQWLGKKSGIQRVEGFCIHWDDKPNDIELVYGCLVTGNLKATNAATGGFVGSRQRAAPITGLWIDLRGAFRQQYELDFQVAFSRSGVLVGRQGKMVSGLGVKDHLVGLQVNLRKKEKI